MLGFLSAFYAGFPMKILDSFPTSHIRVTNLGRKKFRATCNGFTPSFLPETKAVFGA
jgi:hypothetical protein